MYLMKVHLLKSQPIKIISVFNLNKLSQDDLVSKSEYLLLLVIFFAKGPTEQMLNKGF